MTLSILNRITTKDRAFFAQQLSTMINAGLPLVRSLEILKQQTKKPVMKEVISEIDADLEQGVSFSKSLSKHPQVFNDVFVSIIRSGETSGKLDQVLKELAKQLESDYRFISKLRAALYYPIFLIVAMIVVAIIMMTKIIPQIEQVFKDMNAEMPWATVWLMAVSNFLIYKWWLVILIVIFLIIFGRYYFRSEQGRYVYNHMQIYTPLIRQVTQEIYMTRLTRTMAMLVGSGVEIIKAVNIVADVMNNVIFAKSLKEVSSQIERGIPMSVPLSKDPLYPVLVSQMVAVGEQTGKIDEVLRNLANYYEEESENKIRAITSLVEPMIIVIIGIGIGIMVFAILMPIYNIAQLQ